MKAEHEAVIEAMVLAADDGQAGCAVKFRMMEAALRAAAERGYVLAKIPKRNRVWSNWDIAWNACLDAIETIKLEN